MLNILRDWFGHVWRCVGDNLLLQASDCRGINSLLSSYRIHPG